MMQSGGSPDWPGAPASFRLGLPHDKWPASMRKNKIGGADVAFYFLGKLFGHNFKSCNGSFRVRQGGSIKSQYLPQFLEYGNIFCPKDLVDAFVGFMVPTEDGGLACLGYVTQDDIRAQPVDHGCKWLVPTVVFELKQMRDIQEII